MLNENDDFVLKNSDFVHIIFTNAIKYASLQL